MYGDPNSTSKQFIRAVSDVAAISALETGWLQISGADTERVVARQVVERSSGDEIVFERLTESKRPGFLDLWVQTTRAFSLTATLTPCLVVLTQLLTTNREIRVFYAITAMLGVLLLQIAINVFNDVEDYRKLIDLPGNLGGSGVLQNGWWTPLQLRIVARTAFIAGVILGLPSIISHPKILTLIAFTAALGVLRYSARTYGLKYWALGDIAVWILCGPALTIGFAVSAAGDFGFETFLVGSLFGWLAVGILHANNLQDISVDSKRQVKTFAIVLGFKRSIAFLKLCYVLAFLSSMAAGFYTGKVVAYAVSTGVMLAMAWPWLNSIQNAESPGSALLKDCRIKSAQIHLLSGLALVLCLAIANRFAP